jgi:hypothetical protein
MRMRMPSSPLSKRFVSATFRSCNCINPPYITHPSRHLPTTSPNAATLCTLIYYTRTECQVKGSMLIIVMRTESSNRRDQSRLPAAETTHQGCRYEVGGPAGDWAGEWERDGCRGYQGKGGDRGCEEGG